MKDLEEKDIGRPSTYAPIVATLIDRKYISKEKKSLIPTELGFIVTDMMEQYFKEIVDAGFTAQMEDNLDDIESKGVRWKSVIEDFYGTLKEELDIDAVAADAYVGPCPKCGKDIVARKSKKGRVFYGCSGYPECTQSYWNKPIDRKCPKCGELLVEKKSKDAKYACSNSECDYKE